MFAFESTHKKTDSLAARSEELLQLVSFNVAEEEYALPILKVQEIIRMQSLTRVPNSPPFVEGVINLRGKVIPVVGLRKRFGLGAQTHGRQTRVVVAEVTGAIIGFVVDSVSEVLRISPAAIEQAPRLGNSNQEFVAGVVKLEGRLLILLDVERVMTDSETVELLTQEPPPNFSERDGSLAASRR
ncbi:MAG: chemotaxis protein CheW [Candidatus Acidiferrales bacterium]